MPKAVSITLRRNSPVGLATSIGTSGWTRLYSSNGIFKQGLNNFFICRDSHLASATRVFADTLAWATGTHVGAGDHATKSFCILYGCVLGLYFDTLYFMVNCAHY